MKHLQYYIGLLPLLLAACASQPAEGQNRSASAQLPLGEMLTDSSQFPVVRRGGERLLQFQAYEMRFQLAHQAPLMPKLNHQIPWVKPDDYNPNNGIFITYVRDGYPVNLSAPYVQAQYMARSLPGCSTIDSVFLLWDRMYLSEPDAQALRPAFNLSTDAGVSAVCKEYRSGTQGGKRTPKWIAYAYIEYSPAYLVGFALSTTDPEDFRLNQELFYSLIRSYRPF
jgi:hypothetical protein